MDAGVQAHLQEVLRLFRTAGATKGDRALDAALDPSFDRPS
jgi:hypothetical protein